MSDLHYALTLFVTGTAPRSIRAIANLRTFCEAELGGRYELEIVDLFEHPERAQPSNIIVSPTLVRSEPKPVRLLIGDLSDRSRLSSLLKEEAIT